MIETMLAMIVLVLWGAACGAAACLLYRPKKIEVCPPPQVKYVTVDKLISVKAFSEDDIEFWAALSAVWQSDEVRSYLKRIEESIVQQIEDGGDGLDHKSGALWGTRNVMRQLQIADSRYRELKIMAEHARRTRADV
jgi:gas vesicle protein